MIHMHNNTINIKNHKFYSTIHSATLIGLIGHSCFVLIFILLKMPFMAFLNIVSVCLYSTGLVLNKNKYHKITLYLGIIDVITHVIVAVLYLGWNSGFHYYIICLIPIIFFASPVTFSTQMRLFLLSFSAHVALKYLTSYITPFYIAEKSTLIFLSYFNAFATFTIISVLAHYYSVASAQTENTLKTANKELETLAFTDPLTGLLNRRTMLKEIEHQFKMYTKHQKPLSIIIADIDDFKRFNDKYSHSCGDYVLVSISSIMSNILKSKGKISRWGGEEFMIILPETEFEEGKKIAEKIRERVSSSVFNYGGHNLSVSMTFGVSEYRGHSSISDLINKADKCLYQGKHNGKNCVAS